MPSQLLRRVRFAVFALVFVPGMLASRAALAAAPANLGPNVLVFRPSMPAAQIQKQIDRVYALQQHSEFGPARYALLFLPGHYSVDVPIGFYTQVVGLGASPEDTVLTGNVHSDATLPHNNATCTFWRAVEGFTVVPAGGATRWAVSQAAPFRRMHIRGDLVLHQNHGWASGGWMSDSLIDGNVDAGPQQQWISRNSEWKSWTGSNWNMVFVGVPHPPAGQWPQPPFTKIARTPVIREKPFLQADAHGRWSLR
ncbi:MAG: coagulation factor 5/8 type domain-containing protein, partial [Terriglobales bacterium]